MKSEPQVFSFDDLLKAPQQTCTWEGIRNYQARNFMRDAMKLGDKVLFYHSSTAIPGIVGIAEIASEAYPDPSQFDAASEYFDAKAQPDKPRWLLVEVKALRKLSRFLALAELKNYPELRQLRLLQKGNRLSIMPLSQEEFAFIVGLAEKAEF